MCPTIEVIFTILPYLFFNIFLIAYLHKKNVDPKLRSITFFHSSSFIRNERLSIFIPALLTKTSKPTSCDETFSINSSILECSEISNLKIFIFGKFFFSKSNFSLFVPVANTFPCKSTNFFTNDCPIPPVAPVIKIFLFLKSIIQIYIFYVFYFIHRYYVNTFVNSFN